MARWLVTGAAGMLGREADQILRAAGHEVEACDRNRLDVTDARAVHDAVRGCDIVVNAAAWTDVDGAEKNEADATALNGTAVENLATACAESHALLLHISTDYVFPGTARAPIPEDAPPEPINAYGRSKLAGESAVTRMLPRGGYIVRTAWLYGEHGRNFVTTILRAAEQRDFLDVVDDQRGQPTSAGALAAALLALGLSAMAEGAPPGVYHATCRGETTWYGLARAAFELTGLDPDRVRPTTTDKFPRPAPRPAYSVLRHDRWEAAGLPPLPAWQDSLAAFLSAG
ncbi:MAG TPA: dTDP-4-dehydrorhamnose reductase [Actinocrinis sp.]|uniref:dTDP-4-dehydrorhamnose reductase n=1 Tax=Actinocrinis sp. TaxID=1920516 RepID=UPI002DDD81BA|nr:dTDP-4-dehydrorhamnose reductase [Actinocrinis sp.]HEV3171266.1 dTDP-4-dehydrorhamnose reductase [Actinocrinis sp.]